MENTEDASKPSNLKSYYTFNLDFSRAMIAGGGLLCAFGFFFFLGSWWSTNNKDEPTFTSELEIPIQTQDKKDDKFHRSLENLNKENLQNNNIIKEVNTANNQEEQILLSEILPVKDDPMIYSPKRKVIKRSSKHITKKKTTRISSVGKLYTIQVAAFKKQSDAKRLSLKMKSLGFKARVEKGTRFYFVRSGRANNKNSLQSLSASIEKKIKVKTLIIKKDIS